jgi:hypothetical protein
MMVVKQVSSQDLVDAAFNSPDHPFYSEAVPGARAHLHLALGAMERALRDGAPALPNLVKPIYEEMAKRPLRAFVLGTAVFLAAIAGIGQFALALAERLKI